MIEYYAKIMPIKTGIFRYSSTIWKSEDGIDSVYNIKKFININGARRWSERMLSKAVVANSNAVFIKEKDILRRKWND